MQYRNDIQILRGIAVIFVVFFHFGITHIKSGFLGVDMFFVISGFLMSKLYVDGQVKQFYDRRARRLLPAYFVTVLTTLIAAMIIVLPVDMDQVATQSIFASFFISNIGFWLQNSYFSKAEFNPLLHLWSLGVEIQFYVLVPFLLPFVRRRPVFLLIGIIGGLLACLLVTSVSPKTSFFFMPLRIWEFLCGVAVAEGWLAYPGAAAGARGSAVTTAVLRYVSLTLLLTIPFIPLKVNSPSALFGHPGLAAAVTCIATSGVLAFGLPNLFEASVVGRALVQVGNWSYSIYLAHFPVLVLFAYKPFSGTRLAPLTWSNFIIESALVLAFSSTLYLGVERHSRKYFSTRRAAIAIACVIIGAFVAPPLLSNLYKENEQKIFAAWTDRSVYRCGKTFRIAHPVLEFCELPGGNENRTPVMFVGNSHADSLKESFGRIAQKHGYRVYFPVANDPLMNPHYSADWLITEARRLDVRLVFLHFSPFPGLDSTLAEVQKKLEKADIKTIVLMPVPVYESHIPSALYFKQKDGSPLPSQTLSEYYSANAATFKFARGVDSAFFRYFDVAPYLCNPICEVIDESGRPLYFDGGHLTLTGARRLEPAIEAAIVAASK